MFFSVSIHDFAFTTRRLNLWTAMTLYNLTEDVRIILVHICVITFCAWTDCVMTSWAWTDCVITSWAWTDCVMGMNWLCDYILRLNWLSDCIMGMHWFITQSKIVSKSKWRHILWTLCYSTNMRMCQRHIPVWISNL